LVFFDQKIGGLAFTHNNNSLGVFYWESLVELALHLVSRHKCKTPLKNVWFWKFHNV